MFNSSTVPKSSPAGHAEAGEAFAVELGRRLVEAGVLDDLALRRADRARQQAAERLDVVLIRLGLVPESTIAATIAQMLGLPLAAAADFPSHSILADRIAADFLKRRKILPLEVGVDRLVVAVADPFDRTAVEDLAFELEKPIELRIGTSSDIEQALGRLYGATDVAGVAAGAAATASAPSEEDARHLADLASEAPVIKLVQDLIVRAVESRASDIHVEQRPDCLCIRFRIDGVLHTVERLLPDLAAGVVSRIKILSRLDIAERRMAQDGRTRSVVRGRELDIRVSTIPTMNGECCVLRLLDPATLGLELPALGFGASLLQDFSELLRRPHGIVLVTGPTGSGKTTTLYTALGLLDSETRKILTVEDPVEYRIAGINQIQVQPQIGLTFASALRSILRQDPDVIMVGEIRDIETAQMAIQASLTGHLVLSTVHTNSAAASMTRLIDMGLESYLLASSVSGVLAQRLVRRLCRVCASPMDAPAELVARLVAEAGPSLSPEARAIPRLMARNGCSVCRNTGYSGRIAIGELMALDKGLRGILHRRASEQEIESAAIEGGMTTLHQAGLSKALSGETTLEEVLRVTRMS